MGKFLGHVYNVSKGFKSAKSVELGDYKTKEEAEFAMMQHYKNNPKRGDFFYRISDCDLEEMDGIVFRKITISLCGTDEHYYKKYSKQELASM